MAVKISRIQYFQILFYELNIWTEPWCKCKAFKVFAIFFFVI